ncbi:hypothetical protein HYV12_03775 [Candidatus Dojkabacteria bacterium]|nr:hypothetical protein [Candidatus Dojkabacteria bacterium]
MVEGIDLPIRYEFEPQGRPLSMGEVVYLAMKGSAPPDIRNGCAVPEDPMFHRVQLLISELTILPEYMEVLSSDDFCIELGRCCLHVIREIYSSDGALDLETALWSKYFSNEARYSLMRHTISQTGSGFSDYEDWLANMRVSKRAIESLQKDPIMESLRTYYRQGNGSKVNLGSIREYQSLSAEWLESLGNPIRFTRGNLYTLLTDEIEELYLASEELLKSSEENRLRKRIDYTFELTDIFNYLMQMLTVQGKDLSEILRRASKTESTFGNTVLWNKRFKRWLKEREKTLDILPDFE